MPTFRLNDAHIWVSFAMCASNSIDPGLRKAPATDIGNDPRIEVELKELGASSIWVQAQKTISQDKTQLINSAIYNARMFASIKPDEALPLIHALLLFNSQSFLSDNACERLSSETFLRSITDVARTSGLFCPGSGCTTPGKAPSSDWDMHWKLWITHESWRRTAWLVYTLDTIASLDIGAKTHIPVRELHHIPLPAAGPVWKAASAAEWTQEMDEMAEKGLGSLLTLDACMTCHTVQAPSGLPLFRRRTGPYARMILVLTLLRGIIDYGSGKPRGGYITKRWVTSTFEGSIPTDPVEFNTFIISRYSRILDYWRRGWDLDNLCHSNYRGAYFVNDALPPYWLCRAILAKLASLPSPTYVPEVIYNTDDQMFEESGPNRLADVNLREMFHMARQFVSCGEGLGVMVNTYVPVGVEHLDDVDKEYEDWRRGQMEAEASPTKTAPPPPIELCPQGSCPLDIPPELISSLPDIFLPLVAADTGSINPTDINVSSSTTISPTVPQLSQIEESWT
ncbi:hypothetical protein DL93DRAFT_2075163 [Clavulina sp. PMI_390]|nr:hypothetical protein DL93DRAFT_2075163 [Clavulina sp. PMI_390]